ncbi:MAG: phosphoribosylamine--glycine ligase [Syntrophales bacterium]|jgi:phosphoribosylamine--glycine ligase|nr:phosphoribosylamine--glycine ligase [Syntrophales bacterium]MCK9528491.1 phosphoribosylamine--glycine ligase [Syntrophales bacterium]MDX9923028.1 phosphoribosylamine--glycine ligase [Syntrophales bacterium]
MVSVLLIGHGAREHVIAETFERSARCGAIYSWMKSNNPGIAALSTETRLGHYGDLDGIVQFARTGKVDFALVGPEDPLNRGAVDALLEAGIPSVGPTKSLARLETSKMFTRNLLEKYGIPGNPLFRTFSSMDGVEEFIGGFASGAVIKPDGLTGGKGVMVEGDHFTGIEQALSLCEAILKQYGSVLVEEKLEGEEYSLQCFCDGKTVVPMPAVQDHKRRFAGDEGPNTGGMGSYSAGDHSLPFLRLEDIAEGRAITEQVADAVYRETGSPYKGIMYGGFMVTAGGVRLLEYNARFGDPEAMNVLPLLKTDFVDLCMAVIDGTLSGLPIEFEKKATVCKYVVPRAYGLPADHPDGDSRAAKIIIGRTSGVRVYYSSVDQRDDGLYMTSSRALGVVGIADDLPAAEKRAERAVASISGPVDHRSDIGTAALINRRIEHMKKIRG